MNTVNRTFSLLREAANVHIDPLLFRATVLGTLAGLFLSWLF